MVLSNVYRFTVFTLVIFLAFFGVGCPSNGSGGGGGSDPTPAEAASALDAVMSTMGIYAAGEGVNGPAGITADGESSPQTWTFTGCSDPLTGYTLTGTLVVTSVESTTMLVNLSGTLTLTGAPVTQLLLNTTYTLNPEAGTMTPSGSVTADGAVYDFSTFDITAGAAGALSPQLMGVWKSTDPATSFVLFFLPGNFLQPVHRTEESSPYLFTGPVALQYNTALQRFESHDGANWWASGGFSADHNMMAVTVGGSGGMLWPVFYGGDPATWWNDTWDYTMWSSGNSHYSSVEYAITAPEGLSGEITIDYSGILSSDSPDSGMPVTYSLTATAAGDAASGTLTVKAPIDDPNITVDDSMTYATMGNYLVFGPLAALDETPLPAEVAIFQRQ